MSLTILSVAFPMTSVRPDSTGGAEQVLAEIDRGLVRRGHKSLVIACPGSQVTGELIPTRKIEGVISTEKWIEADEAIRQTMKKALERYEIDLVHMHGLYFADCLPHQDVPVLATLHVPVSWYKPGGLKLTRPRTYLNCVSHSQRATVPRSLGALPVIENGIRTDLLRPATRIRKKKFIVSLGRICPEKGFHLALKAAKQAGLGMVLAGSVLPFADHERYFAEEIVPELDARRRYAGQVGMRRKRQLLCAARCAVVPSLVPETRSLVAREALSCGTPVVAFRRGALPEAISHGKTGFLVNEADELVDAIRACDSLDPAECRRVASERFSAEKMVDEYIETYRRILQRAPSSEASV